MDMLGFIFGSLLAGLRQTGDSQVASTCDVIHSSMQLDDAIEQPKSQIKPAFVALAAIGLGFSILGFALQSRKNSYYA